MATVLNLPAHADIHEFSVMFTNDVRKKAKNWHDGYLKWHTFNFRAILYDAQRKVVSSEFFPNRTINANTDIDFSNAIVQIGDQMETLQANLEHVYRKDHRSTAVEKTALPVQTSPIHVQPPQSPNIPRSIQKRVYPTSAAHGMSPLNCLSNPSRTPVRGINITHTNETPLATKVARRAIGIPRSSLSGKTLTIDRTYPLAASQVSPIDFQQAAMQPGWFAREDLLSQRQSSSQASPANVRDDSTKPVAKKVAKKRARPNVVPQVEELISESSIVADQNMAIVIESSNESTEPAGRHANTGSEHSRVEPLHDAAPNHVELVQGDVDTAPKSRLDPTRTRVKPKPRTFLAAKRQRSISSEPQEARSCTSLSKRSMPAIGSEASALKRNSVVEALPEIPMDETIYDVDSATWVSDTVARADRTRQENKSEALQDVCVRVDQLETQPVDDPGKRREDLAEDVIVERLQRSDENSCLINQAPRVSMRKDMAYQARTMAKLRTLLSTDEDGFLTEVPRKGKSKRTQSVSKSVKKIKRRAASDMIETFTCSPHTDVQIIETPSEKSSTQLRSRQASPLFMPDSSQDSTNDRPGLLTQFAARAAKDIAKRSSIRRIGPAALARKPLHPRLHLQTLTKKDKVEHKTAQAPVPPPPPAEIVTQAPVPQTNFELRARSADETCDQASQRTIDALFPSTPVNLETEDLDTVFASHEEALSHRKEAAPKRKAQSTKVSRRRDEKCDAMLATQLNTRAPDFMTAKSFSRGSILRLDETMPSVGLSSRQLNSLDAEFPSQLSG